MEVKLVITPSEEMVSLVKSVLAVFTANNLVDKVAEMQKFAAEQKQPNFESGGLVQESIIDEKIEEIKAVQMQPESVKKRRTKAEIEAEKQIETAPEKAPVIVVEQSEETTTVEGTLGFVPDVVKLRKMTVRRSELIGDVPAKLLEFGYNSVTSLAKDAAAAEKYFNYLVSVSPISAEDNA